MNSEINTLKEEFLQLAKTMQKMAFTPTAPPAPPMAAQGPPPEGMPPQGGPPPEGMPPEGMPPQGPPPQGGAMPPELEGILSQMAQGMETMTSSVTTQQQTIDQLTKRVMEMESQQESISNMLKGPSPFADPNTQPPQGEMPPMS